MNVIENILSDVVGSLSDFFVNSLAPWAWENKAWLAAVVPLVVVIAVVKYLWG